MLTDSSLAPAAQSEDFQRTWIFITEQPTAVDSTANMNDAGGISASDTSVTVTDGTLFTVGDGIQFGAGSTPDAEIMLVTAIVANALTITRGIQSTTAATHADVDNVFIVGPAIGEIARVTNVDFSGSLSNLTLAPSLSCSLISGTDYEIHYKFYPNNIRDKANEILENIRRTIWLPLSLITDGDMETTGVTNWTAATATLAKNTTTVLYGRQTLSITATAANGQARSASVFLPPNTEVFCAALVYITSGDSAKLTLYDVTNSADIETAASAATGWVLFAFIDTLPATCEAVQLRLESQANTDVTYWNFAVLLPIQRRVFDYPGTLEWSEDFDEVFYMPLGTGLSATTDDSAYRMMEQPFKKWSSSQIIRDETAVVPYRIELTGGGSITKPLFVRGYVDYSTLTADTDTTAAPEDIVVDLTYADMMDAWAQEDLAEDKPELAVTKSAKATQIRQMLAPRMMHFFKPRGVVRGSKR